MSEDNGNPLSNLPPWLWLAVLLGGGGTLGGLGLGGSGTPSEAVQAQWECDDAWQAYNQMIDSYNLILKELLECSTE